MVVPTYPNFVQMTKLVFDHDLTLLLLTSTVLVLLVIFDSIIF